MDELAPPSTTTALSAPRPGEVSVTIATSPSLREHNTPHSRLPRKARLVRLDIDLCLTRGFFFLLELIINDVTLNSVNVTGQDTMKTMGLLPLDRNKQASSSEEAQGWTLQLSVRCDASSAIGHSTLPEGRRRTQAGE